MVYCSVKVKQNTFELFDKAKSVFLKHHPDLMNRKISNDEIIHNALRYYIEN